MIADFDSSSVPTPLISYILVTYNSRDHFPAVFKNLKKYTPYPHEIVTIDNASSSQDYLMGDRTYRLDSNTYFTHAVNVGLEKIHPKSKYIILVNPDLRIFKTTISTLIKETDETNADIAGGLIVRYHLKIQHGGGAEGELAPLKPHTHDFCNAPFYKVHDQFPRECRWVSGSFFLITRSALETLGPLDEKYPHYESDLEYCLQAKEKGLKVVCSSALCLHFSKRSSRSRSYFGSRFAKLRYAWQWYKCSLKIFYFQKHPQKCIDPRRFCVICKDHIFSKSFI